MFLLVDGDDNRSCLSWSEGKSSCLLRLWMKKQPPKYYRNYENVIIDTAARPDKDELKALAEGSDLLIVPCTPDSLSIKALSLTVKALKEIGTEKYRILLTIVPPRTTKDADEVREMLARGRTLPCSLEGIRSAIAFKRAALQGIPVYQVKDKRAKEAWSDYVAVGEEILNEF